MRAALPHLPLPLSRSPWFLAPSRPANFIQCRFGGKLHNKKLCLPFASSEWACPRPLPLPLFPAVCVCRLRLILPHSFGSNLSCHAVIMTNKKRTGEKKLFIENDYAQGVGQVEAQLACPTLLWGSYRVGLSRFSPVNDSMTPWSWHIDQKSLWLIWVVWIRKRAARLHSAKLLEIVSKLNKYFE